MFAGASERLIWLLRALRANVYSNVRALLLLYLRFQPVSCVLCVNKAPTAAEGRKVQKWIKLEAFAAKGEQHSTCLLDQHTQLFAWSHVRMLNSTPNTHTHNTHHLFKFSFFLVKKVARIWWLNTQREGEKREKVELEVDFVPQAANDWNSNRFVWWTHTQWTWAFLAAKSLNDNRTKGEFFCSSLSSFSHVSRMERTRRTIYVLFSSASISFCSRAELIAIHWFSLCVLVRKTLILGRKMMANAQLRQFCWWQKKFSCCCFKVQETSGGRVVCVLLLLLLANSLCLCLCTCFVVVAGFRLVEHENRKLACIKSVQTTTTTSKVKRIERKREKSFFVGKRAKVCSLRKHWKWAHALCVCCSRCYVFQLLLLLFSCFRRPFNKHKTFRFVWLRLICCCCRSFALKVEHFLTFFPLALTERNKRWVDVCTSTVALAFTLRASPFVLLKPLAAAATQQLAAVFLSLFVFAHSLL